MPHAARLSHAARSSISRHRRLLRHGYSHAPCGRVLQLRGAYRRMMCKPQRLECELLRFDKPREPLLPPPFGHADAVHGTHRVPDTAAPARKHLAAKLTFELPSGSYATSLLRELVADECAIRPGAA